MTLAIVKAEGVGKGERRWWASNVAAAAREIDLNGDVLPKMLHLQKRSGWSP